MAQLVLSVVAFIVAIGILVSVHEFGHFWVARKLGFRVLRFSVGFGKPLVRWYGNPFKVLSHWLSYLFPQFASSHAQKDDPTDSQVTEYWLSAIPLGGYVKLLDEREGPVPEEQRHLAFNRRPIPHRISVLMAGPGFNFLFAILVYWIMFVSGVPGIKPIIGTVAEDSIASRAGLKANDEIIAVGQQVTQTLDDFIMAILDDLLADDLIPLTVVDDFGEKRQTEIDLRGQQAELTEPGALFEGLGIEFGPSFPALIGEVTSGAAAELAGIQAGDRVVSADGHTIQSWAQWVRYVRERPGEMSMVTVIRGRSEFNMELQIGSIEEEGKLIGRIGAAPDLDSEAVQLLVERVRTEQRYGVLVSLGKGIEKTWDMAVLTLKMLGSMLVGDVSVRNLSGPISIAAYAGDSAGAGASYFLGFLAVVSISLGILNLLPIPLLDGGQIVYQLLEWIKGSPLSERAMIFGQQLGILFFIVLMSFAFYNDITRLLSGNG